MPGFKPILMVIGILLAVLALAMFVPAVADYLEGNPDWKVFLASALITLFVGGALVFANWGRVDAITRQQGFLLTTAGWVAVAFFGALPFRMSGLGLGWGGAVFEAVSGLTTTGSTVISGLDGAPPGILLWRGLLQALGGIGIVFMAIVMLPFLRIGGMQLFRTESSEQTQKVVPRVAQWMVAMTTAYSGIIFLNALAYWAAGMTGFEAAIHAMATVSTGGFGTSDASLGHFHSPAILWIAIVFMAAGGLPFVLYVQALHGKPRLLFRNSQVRALLATLLVASAVLAAWAILVARLPPLTAVTESIFAVTSIVTTTGFASADYTQWGSFPVVLMVVLSAVGACTGSTAGGIKIFRFQILFSLVRRQLFLLVFPNASRTIFYQGDPVAADVARSILMMFMFYVLTVMVLTIVLGFAGLDFQTALSGALTAVGNVGPGVGPIIGPSGNFSTLPEAAHWALAAGMLVGRLEFTTVYAVLMIRFWRM